MLPDNEKQMKQATIILLVSTLLLSCRKDSETTLPQLSISPSYITIGEGETAQFTAQIKDMGNQNVIWEVLSLTGNITSTGLYLAPSQVSGDSIVIVIKAKSAVDEQINNTAVVVIKNTQVDTTGNPPPSSLTYTTQIKPIINANCAYSGCHAGSNPAEGIHLGTYAGVMELVYPNQPGESELYEVITEDDEDDMMPPNGPLPQAQIQLIYQWIANGAPEN